MGKRAVFELGRTAWQLSRIGGQYTWDQQEAKLSEEKTKPAKPGALYAGPDGSGNFERILNSERRGPWGEGEGETQ